MTKEEGLRQRIENECLWQMVDCRKMVDGDEVLTELEKTIVVIKKLRQGQKGKKSILSVIAYDDALNDVLKSLDSENSKKKELGKLTEEHRKIGMKDMSHPAVHNPIPDSEEGKA